MEVEVAIDSGAVAGVISPKELPANVVVTKDPADKDFRGANNSKIKNHGKCVTTCIDSRGRQVLNRWNAADVSRALQSVSQITGPEEAEVGNHDVLFNNKRCVVVPPGVVERIMKLIAPITEYTRKGGLYVGKVKMSGFARQGQQR